MKPQPKQAPIQDKKYLAFIRKQPCLACSNGHRFPFMEWGTGGKSHAHHPKAMKHGGELGKNVKADDIKAMPLCWMHHAESEGGEDRFYDKYGILPKAEAKRLQLKYEVENEK